MTTNTLAGPEAQAFWDLSTNQELHNKWTKTWGPDSPYKGKVRSNGLDGKKREYYTWDYTHNDIEVFNSRGVHMGSLDPTTGELYKPAVKGRTL